MSMQWGEISSKDKIKKTIVDYWAKKNKGVDNISFTHIKSGFTDNVFKIEILLTDKTIKYLILKEYLEDWHQKEKKLYQTVLAKNSFLGAPKLIKPGRDYVLLEYLSTKEHSSLSSADIDILKRWLIKKHTFFKQNHKLIEPYKENEKIQIHYLVEKPLNLISKFNEPKLIQLSKGIISLKGQFINIIQLNNLLPITLEHGDLEPQNLLVDSRKRLRVTDWVNARQGSGLFDINQYFETAKDLGITLNIQKETNEFAKATKLDNLNQLLPLIRIIMLLNKIHFYGDKYLNNQLFSPSKKQSTYTMLTNYLKELNELLQI